MEKNNNSKNKLTPKALKKVDKSLIKSNASTSVSKTTNSYSTPYNSNVSKKGKSTKKDKQTKNKKKKKGWKIFKICIFVLLALFIIGAGVVIGVISGVIDKTDGISVEDIISYNETSFVYDKDNNQIGQLYDSENRVTIEYKDLPQHVIDAVVSIEDERFFSHNGVDIKRTMGAIFTYIFNGGDSNFGGSTITQQLVKNSKQDTERSWTRKIREWYRAITLETKVPKEDILAYYLNTIYLGDGAYGIEVAAENYFGKSIKDVNIAEAAALAAMIQTPEATNPYKSDEAKQKLLERKDLVLSQMLKLGKITKEQYEEAKAYNLEFKKAELKSASGDVQTYYVDAVFEQVKEDLMEELGLTEIQAIKRLYSAGLKIYTPQDSKVQKAIDDTFNNSKWFYKEKNGDFMQAAAVVIDQKNGNVLGLIGGADKKTGARQFNRATQAYRQPGSCMKPFGAYGPAMEQGLIGPGSGVDDSPLPKGTYNPENYYHSFYGYVTVRDAIQRSMNLPAVRTNMKLDVSYALNFARNCGLKDLVTAKQDKSKNDESAASLALGGLTKGVTPIQLASAYATIANGGLYIEPKLYTKVVDRNGKEILVANSDAKRVMKDSTSYMLTSCLESVVKTGTAAGYIKAGNMAVAGKTGNTNGDVDQWFCGFTPYYTVACWNGYDKPREIGYRSFGNYPYTSILLFNSIVSTISKGQTAKQFEKPASVIEAAVCRDSGLVATDACKTDPRGDRTNTDFFAKGTVPTETCNVHKKVKICNETGKLATEYCPNTTEKSFISRDYEPPTKPADYKYMVPKETCNVHTTPGSGSGDNISIYTTGQ